MPNWCYNELVVSGDAKQLAKFKKKAHRPAKDEQDETALSLANLYPEPDYTKVKVKHTFPSISGKGYVAPDQAWWDWRVQNWGTKWDINAEIIDEYDDYIIYQFDSAWSPPVAWLEKVAKDWPELDFRIKYEEEGAGFIGVAKAHAGVTNDQSIDL